MDKISQIKREIFISMKMMDTTIKDVKESEEFTIYCNYGVLNREKRNRRVNR